MESLPLGLAVPMVGAAAAVSTSIESVGVEADCVEDDTVVPEAVEGFKEAGVQQEPET